MPTDTQPKSVADYADRTATQPSTGPSEPAAIVPTHNEPTSSERARIKRGAGDRPRGDARAKPAARPARARRTREDRAHPAQPDARCARQRRAVQPARASLHLISSALKRVDSLSAARVMPLSAGSSRFSAPACAWRAPRAATRRSGGRPLDQSPRGRGSPTRRLCPRARRVRR